MASGTFRPSRGQYIFIACLAISLLFWTLNRLSKTYTVRRKVCLNYTGLPKGQALLNSPPAFLEVELKGHGFDVLLFDFSSNTDSLELVISKLPQKGFGDKKFAFASPESILYSINRQFYRTISVERVYSDTLFMRFDKITKKEVKVLANIDISYQKGLIPIDSNLFTPHTVFIEGPESIIDSIYFLMTDTFIVEDLNENLSQSLDIILPDKRLKVSALKVDVFIELEKISEKTIKLEIEKTFLGTGELIAYPSSIYLKMNIPVSKFDLESPYNNLKAIIDTNNMKERKLLPILIEGLPHFAEISEIRPSKVEYLISMEE